jgi:hypothetical protein
MFAHATAIFKYRELFGVELSKTTTTPHDNPLGINQNG